MKLLPYKACFASLACLSAIANASEPEANTDFFERRIRPLLASKCYECHSTQEGKRKGGLLLDSKTGWENGGDSGPALRPGQPGGSLLIRAVSWEDPGLQMPPKNPLSNQEKQWLREWIAMGAPDPRADGAAPSPVVSDPWTDGQEHWSYQPVSPSTPPEISQHDWPEREIDRFILSKLESSDLRPAPAADPQTLVRRLSYHLTGLPPDPRIAADFLHEPSSANWSKLVDDLLSSPAFGERWARHWLDVARYGDSVTLRGLVFTDAWRYRDYVIDAFNSDMPFDQFIREQIAGDLLPATSLEEKQRQRVATTFLSLGNTNFEEQDKGQLDMDVVDEQLDTLGKAFLAQTIGCARCHDHKFDPIPTADYYAMAGILRSVTTMEHANVSRWVDRPLPLPEHEEQRFQQLDQTLKSVQAKIEARKAEIAKLGAPESNHPVALASLPGIVVDDSQAIKVGDWKHSTYSKSHAGDGYIHDDQKDRGMKSLTYQPKFPRAGQYEIRVAYNHAASRASRVQINILHADGEETVYLDQREAPPINGLFSSIGRYRFEANDQGFVLISNTDADGYVIADAIQFLPVDQTELVQDGADNESDDTAARARENLAAEINRLESEAKQLRADIAERPIYMSVKEGPVSDSPIHIRGSVHTLGDVVPRGFLQVAFTGQPPSIPAEESGRAQLANWISSEQNPLTARVIVNRVWHWIFGDGMVRTVDNFGTTGEAPSHPELLDYLATQFMENNWSIKWLVREIALSSAYQMASAHHSEHAMAVDPQNRLLWRMNRQRLTAEAVRDTILTVSGELDRAMGGREFPINLSADYGFEAESDRRSIYLPVFRNAIPEIFEAFDFPEPSMVAGRRNTSTVAPQALFLMNDEFVIRQSERAAQRLLNLKLVSDKERLDQAFQWTLGRNPASAEASLILDHLRQEPAPETAWAQIFQSLFASLDFHHLN